MAGEAVPGFDSLDAFGQRTTATVTANGAGGYSDPLPPAQDVPAPAASPLAALRKRVQAARAARHLDLRVPDVVGLVVRYRPLTRTEVDAIAERWPEKPAAERQWLQSVATLVTACAGVFEEDEQGKPKGDPASWPRFGAEMAEEMGLDVSGLSDGQGALLREFFVAGESDAMLHGERVWQWSQRVGETLERQTPEA